MSFCAQICFTTNQLSHSMHVERMIHKMLANVMHLKRCRGLSQVVKSAFDAKQLSVTGLGRGLLLPTQERSAIRKVDRLVGNEHLHYERNGIYQHISRQLIGNQQRPWIIVDWSPHPNSTEQILRAALVCEGRALSIWDEVHPESKLGNRQVHKKFLKQLKWLLPEGCQPIIVTDAGFHTSWFKQVGLLGWDYVGRVRGLVKYQPEGESDWFELKCLHAKSSPTARRFGKVLLSKSYPVEGTLCYYKGKARGRISRNKLGQKRQCSDSKDYSRSAKEPWVLMTSIDGHKVAERVVKIYRTRMQIEEGFRDLKSSQYGFGFEQSYTQTRYRIENLLLIAMLASLVAWLAGWQGEQEKRHYEFQANSVKERRVLSLFYLGCRLIKKKVKLKIKPLNEITERLKWCDSYA